MLVSKVEKCNDELKMLMKLYYWLKSRTDVLNYIREKMN